MSAASPSLESWFAAELAKSMSREPTNSPGILLGCPVWGDTYISRLEKFCLPSLLAPANLIALRAANARLVLFTDPEGLQPLWHATAAVDAAGIKVQIYPMPAEILNGEHGLHKYMVLGAVQNLLLQWASRAGQGFHFVCPDHLYNDRYFHNMVCLAEKHEAIAHGAVSVDLEVASPEIDAFRGHGGRTLSIPADQLGDIGFRCLHQQMFASLLLEGAKLPMSQTLIWPGREALHFAGPIFNPVWLSPRLVRRAPCLFPTTFDAEIPKLMPEGFHIPGPEDGMVFVEVSDRTKGMPRKLEDLDAWVAICWLQMNFDNAYLPVFARRTVIPHAGYPEGLLDAEIDDRHIELMAAITAGKFAAMETFFANQNRQARPFLRGR